MVNQGTAHITYHYLGALLLVATLVGMMEGCQQSNELPVRAGSVVVGGAVTLDRIPLERAQIAFIAAANPNPKDRDQWHEASINFGKYEIELPPGDYSVRIHQYTYSNTGITGQTLPVKYNDETTLSANVEERGKNQISFHLESK